MSKPSIVSKGPVRHPVLPDGMIERIRGYKAILGDVEPGSVEDAIIDFRRDANPEKEIVIWERIAATVATYLAHNPTNDQRVRDEVFAVVLGASTGEQDSSGITRLSPAQINHIVLNYKGLNQPVPEN